MQFVGLLYCTLNNTLQINKGLSVVFLSTRWVLHDSRALKVPKMEFYFISPLLLDLEVWNVWGAIRNSKESNGPV